MKIIHGSKTAQKVNAKRIYVIHTREFSSTSLFSRPMCPLRLQARRRGCSSCSPLEFDDRCGSPMKTSSTANSPASVYSANRITYRSSRGCAGAIQVVLTVYISSQLSRQLILARPLLLESSAPRHTRQFL